MTGYRRISPPKHPIGRSIAPSASTEVLLRQVARGTSHPRPRLAFHPYAQVIRVICTSTSVRSSTLLSKGFDLPRHRSTGFGHRTQDSSRAHDAPRPLRGCGLVAFAAASLVKRLTSPWIRTPRPVFQNGRHDVAPHPLGCFVAFSPYQSVTVWFQALFTSRQGLFSAFSHPTTALSVSGRV